MRRNLALAFLICLTATAGFAQGGLNGKWATDKEPDPLPLARRNQGVQVEVTVEDSKASGKITIGGLGGTFHTFKDAKVTGNKIMFRVDPPKINDRSWAIEMVDDSTVMLYRGDLPLVTTNVLVLIAPPATPPKELPAPWISEHPTAESCGKTSYSWCVLLHRSK